MSEVKNTVNEVNKKMNNVNASGAPKKQRPISFSETFATKIMPKVYGFGAAVAIMGAMFKLLSLPGGAFMLGAGLSTEAFIFFISAFEKPAKEYDWSIVFPQLDKDYAWSHGITNDKGVTDYNNLPAPFFNEMKGSVNKCGGNDGSLSGDSLSALLEKCKVDQKSLNELGNGIRNLSNLCSEMGNFSKTTIDWNNFSDNFNKINESFVKIADLSSNINVSLSKMNVCFSKITEQSGAVEQIEGKTNDFNNGLSALSSKISDLNKSYDNVIRALRG